MPDLTRDTLSAVGFRDVAAWAIAVDGIEWRLDGERTDADRVLVDCPNALYAFVQGEVVQYIGKTTQGVRKRFAGYRNPARGQSTNLRCHARIREALQAGADVRIMVFTPIPSLRYLDFDINLAAGLEDSLIAAFDPPWNGREKGGPISEDAEREKAEEAVVPPSGTNDPPEPASKPAEAPPLAAFTIRLGQAYYVQGIVNPGVEASRHLGADREPIQVLFDDGTAPILSRIDRVANRTGGVRLVGRNRQIADWFRKRFRPGDVVQARVLDANRILLMSASSRNSPDSA